MLWCFFFFFINYPVITELQRVLKQETDESNKVEVQSPDYPNDARRKYLTREKVSAAYENSAGLYGTSQDST